MLFANTIKKPLMSMLQPKFFYRVCNPILKKMRKKAPPLKITKMPLHSDPAKSSIFAFSLSLIFIVIRQYIDRIKYHQLVTAGLKSLPALDYRVIYEY